MAAEETKIPQTGEGQQLVLRLPAAARIPDGATFYDGPDDTHCRIVKADGQRCRSTRMLATGLCPGHSGTGISADPGSYSTLGHAERKRRAAARATLGISARRAATPVQAARIRAQLRADDYATAIVDRPLDDPDLSTIARQRAAIDAIELLFPKTTTTLELELPSEPDEVRQMSWQDMQGLASRLLEDEEG